MIRVIVKTDDCGMAANVGGSVLSSMRSFVVEIPELESYLSEKLGNYAHRQIIGCEIVNCPPNAQGDL